MELTELYEMKRNLENKIENFFGDGQSYSGDANYQELLERLSDVEDQISEIINNN